MNFDLTFVLSKNYMKRKYTKYMEGAHAGQKKKVSANFIIILLREQEVMLANSFNVYRCPKQNFDSPSIQCSRASQSLRDTIVMPVELI